MNVQFLRQNWRPYVLGLNKHSNAQSDVARMIDARNKFKPAIMAYIQEHGVSYTGEVVASEFDATFEDAARACDARPECIGFHYNHNARTAVLSQTRVEKIAASGNSYFRKIGTLDGNPVVHQDLSVLSSNPHGIAFPLTSSRYLR